MRLWLNLHNFIGIYVFLIINNPCHELLLLYNTSIKNKNILTHKQYKIVGNKVRETDVNHRASYNLDNIISTEDFAPEIRKVDKNHIITCNVGYETSSGIKPLHLFFVR